MKNPSLEIIVTERCSTRGCPLEEACETLLSESKCNFSCCSHIISMLLWRLCWLCYCYYAISSILYFCSAYCYIWYLKSGIRALSLAEIVEFFSG
jgi:hypothetical protein